MTLDGSMCMLIDPQFCTREGHTAPWDYGTYYVDNFIQNHECEKNQYCAPLDLPPMFLEASEFKVDPFYYDKRHNTDD